MTLQAEYFGRMEIIMLKLIKNNVIANELIEKGDRVIVAVSGGPDSMALLHILQNLAGEMQFDLVAAHINHGLRPEADEEQRFVAKQCRRWNVSCYTEEINVRDLARQSKTSLEDAGRIARYRFLNALQAQLGAQSIATAHHRDDVAETVLLHLLRGAGLQGLRGILPRNGQIIRPLLPLGKEQLLSYLNQHDIKYCLDMSNVDPTFLRNRIRQQLIPELQQNYNPRIVDSLNQMAELLRADHELLEQEIERYWGMVLLKADNNTIILDHSGFIKAPLAAQRRLIMRAFSVLTGQAGWEGQDVEQVLRLSTKMGSAKVLQLKKKVRVNKSYDKMIFTKTWSRPIKFSLDISVPGQLSLPDGGPSYHFYLQNHQHYIPQAEDICLDYDKMVLPLILRSRQEGDVFWPAGFSGHKKIKKYFIDQKIPCWERDMVPILASREGEIYAVLGHCIGQQAVVDLQTRTLLVIKKGPIEKNMYKLKSQHACATI